MDTGKRNNRIPRLGPADTNKIRQVVDGIVKADTPLGAIRSLVMRGSAPHTDQFERYAALALRDAGADNIGALSTRYAIHIEPPAEGTLARFVVKGDPSDAERALLSDVEDAINRLICIADAVEDAAMSYSPVPQANVIVTFRGVDRIPRQAGYRSAKVVLPALALAEKPSVAYFNEIDWRMLDNVAGIGREVFQNSVKPNTRQSILGAYAPNGSDWDVRTRLAATLERMELSLRFKCRFDCDVERSIVRVAFMAPPTSSFPRRAPSSRLDAMNPLSEDALLNARSAYALRLACLMACACFGSGRHIEHAYVTAVSSDETPLIRCAFERDRFVKTALSAIDSGQIANPAYRFDAPAIAREIDACWLAFGLDTAQGARPADFSDAPNRIIPKNDTRLLPEAIAKTFGAKRVCDMDTHAYFGGNSKLIEEAKTDSGDSVLAAIASLEQIVANLEEDVAPPDDDAGSRPLYCGNPASRIAVALLADELSIGEQAQLFLDKGSIMEEDGDIEHRFGDGGNDLSFFRAPNALFHAHMGLSDLYQRLGDFAGAIAHADYCLALGPTTAHAYFRKADILAEQTRRTEAANVLMAGLQSAISKRDCALLYYHLALILWQMGRHSVAAAIQVYTSSLEGEFAEKARAVIASIRKRPDCPVIAHASSLAAAREMVRSRIPVMPSDEARSLVAHATLGLSCANAPEAAAPYARILADHLRNDRIVVSACNSLVTGIDHMSE